MKSFKLVTLDLDYTLFLGNSVIYLNKVLGISETLERYHADYRDGKITERELNHLQAPLLQKVSVSKSFECLARGPILKNLDNGLRRLRAAGSDVQMLSMNPLQAFFKASYGIGVDASVYVTEGDRFKLAGTFPENKVELLERYCHARNIDMKECAHVGDSQNDVATFRRVGYSIALNCSDSGVQKESSVSLRTDDFLTVANTLLRANDLV